MDPNRPYITPKEARKFTKEYVKLNKMLTARLVVAESIAEAKEALEMYKGLAQYELPQAKTFYGLALPMEGKPWYDVKKGEQWFKMEAEEAAAAEHDASFCMYQYGLMQGIRKDTITGKYWMEKAAATGFKPAAEVFIGNADLENAIRFSQSIASREHLTIINPINLIANGEGV